MAPTAVVAVITVVGLYAGGVFRADATARRLPSVSPKTLIADLHATAVPGFSGTAVSHMSLGLPALPSSGADDNTTLVSLLSGSHTLQVWYGGEDEQRLAVLGATDETDLFRDGRDLWKWSSADRVALHAVLPEGGQSERAASGLSSPPATPQALSDDLLGALDPNTRVTVRKGDAVAHRPTYDLVLTPRIGATLIGSARISIDAATKIPLAVQIYPRGATAPAIDVAYTSIRFFTPAETVFRFSPPAGATVRQWHPTEGGAASAASNGSSSRSRWRLLSSGWTTVVDYRPAHPVNLGGVLAEALTPVSGSWGSGRLLKTSLVSVLFTRSGRIFAGAVDPGVLYAAAATR